MKRTIEQFFGFPIESDCYLTQGFGMTDYAIAGNYGGSIHNGIDLSGFPVDTPIHAIGNGYIAAIGSSPITWGNWVMVKHVNGFYSLYSHLCNPCSLAVGQRVNHKTVLGGAGNTGASTGVHLHLSLFDSDPGYNKDGPMQYSAGAVDPMEYLNIQPSCNLLYGDFDPAFRHKLCLDYGSC